MRRATLSVGTNPTCRVCGSRRTKPRFRCSDRFTVWGCLRCESLFVEPIPRAEELASVYGADYFRSWGDEGGGVPEDVARMKRATFARHLSRIEREVGVGRLLDVGCAEGLLLEEAAARGWDVAGVDVNQTACDRARRRVGDRVVCGDVGGVSLPGAAFDAVVAADVLEHVPEPAHFVSTLTGLLRPGGVLLVTTPRADGLLARLQGQRWVHLKVPEHIVYCSRRGIRSLFARAGLELLDVRPAVKTMTMGYIASQFAVYRRSVWTPLVRLLAAMAPDRLLEARLPMTGGEMCVVAKRRDPAVRSGAGAGKRKVLLLNPPGRPGLIRACYCSSVSKADYLFHPTDLVMMSGYLDRDRDVSALDCIARRMGPAAALRRIEAERPDAVVALVGCASWPEDVAFLRRVKERLGVTLVANGDVFFNACEETLARHPFIDAVTFDFMSEDLSRYLAGDTALIENMAWRTPDGAVEVRRVTSRRPRTIEMPLPRHDLFRQGAYRFPFARRPAFATVMTTFGCPFACRFCVAARLPFYVRTVDNVCDELSQLRRSGVREIFFEDYTFGSPGERALELCARMAAFRPRFSWTCFSRVDVCDDRMLLAMKRAGCHTIVFGVESADDAILRAYRKGFTTDDVRRCFARCRRLGLRTVATFILGLPEDTAETVERTTAFAREIDCDYASFNVAVPRTGTALREDAVAEGLIEADDMAFDHSGDTIAMPTRALSTDALSALKKRAVRSFYVRGRYLWRRIASIRTWWEWQQHLRQAWSLLKRN